MEEATRHLLRWEITREAGAQADLTWAGILAAAVHAGLLVAVGEAAVAVLVAVDAAAVADTDNESIKILREAPVDPVAIRRIRAWRRNTLVHLGNTYLR